MNRCLTLNLFVSCAYATQQNKAMEKKVRVNGANDELFGFHILCIRSLSVATFFLSLSFWSNRCYVLNKRNKRSYLGLKARIGKASNEILKRENFCVYMKSEMKQGALANKRRRRHPLKMFRKMKMGTIWIFIECIEKMWHKQTNNGERKLIGNFDVPFPEHDSDCVDMTTKTSE